MSQTFNISGFVAGIDIDPDEYLLPLQEVIVNSIQSIEDLKEPKNGAISIKVIRGKQLPFDGLNQQPFRPIEGFEVYDNGVGFIKKRFQAFNNAFTELNKGKGCKGVGRYTVLASFASMEINSTFFEKEGWFTRSFKFLMSGVSPGNDKNLTKAKDHSLKTVTKLNNYKRNFQEYINKNRIEVSDIAEGIIQHCLLYFISNTVPEIRIYNENEPNKSIFLNDIFKSVVKFDSEVKKLKLKTVKDTFNVNYLRNYNNKTHSFHLCANKREVGKKTSVSNYIPSFVQPLEDEGKNRYFLSVYVTSQYLDGKANYQRNKFSLPQKVEDKTPFDEISIEELFKDLSENVRAHYSDSIESADKEKNIRISNYILDPKQPRLAYKHLLTVENIFDDIPANATDERLETELHRKVFHLEQKRSKAFEKAFSKKKYDKEEFSEIVHTVLKEEAAFSVGKLADLTVRRKAVIKLFRKYLDWRNEENYMLEEDLHNIIFTMGAETKTMPQDYHNLWLLDERLTYHSFTTSDKQLRTNEHFKSDSQKETDLLIYDFPWAFSDNTSNINSLVVFEFKRPGRDMNTTKDKKLDSQVEEYFEKLMQSEAKSEKGRFLNIKETTPKFGYIICELHKDLMDYNETYNFFRKTPYNTLFKVNEKLNLYFEVMSYETMLDFAEKRHTAFFKALGIENL